MIRNRTSLSMIESEEYTKDNENSVELNKFIKKFTKIDLKKAKELRLRLQELNFMKVKSDHISKIIDLLPETDEDLNKIFADISLDENETQKILDTVKQFIK
jgi:DNA-directed RNA polymerase subunit F